MSDHTPCHLAVSTDADGQKRLVIDAKSYWANGLFLSDGKFDPEDARRLAACWNACEGLTQDHFDGGWTALGLSKHAKKYEDKAASLERELSAARALLREVYEEGNLDAGDQVSMELDNRIYSYLDACDKPGAPDAS